jgi:hypothetical protein
MDGETHLVDDVVTDQSLYPAIATLIDPLHFPRKEQRGKTIETTRHRHLMERKVGYGKQQREDLRGVLTNSFATTSVCPPIKTTIF